MYNEGKDKCKDKEKHCKGETKGEQVEDLNNESCKRYSIVTGIWDGFVPWTGISWATGHHYCVYCILKRIPAMRPLVVP